MMRPPFGLRSGSATKSTLAACAVAAAALFLPSQVRADNPTSSGCINADPSSALASVTGDFEISYDPADSAGNLIFISNVADGPSSIVAAHMDGLTGAIIPGSLTTVATNFTGQTGHNGPEFTLAQSGRFGLLFQGPNGVTGIFRAAKPTAWNAFNYDYLARPTGLTPPALGNTSPGAINGNPPVPPAAQQTYPQYKGTCTGLCYGAVVTGQATDVYAVMAAAGYTVTSTTQAPQDGYVFTAACDAQQSCGLFEVKIDGAGGLSTMQQVSSTGGSPTLLDMAAALHPVTGSTVLFTNRGQSEIDVWEQTAINGQLNPLATFSVAGTAHFRTATNPTQAVLNYLIRSGATKGSYTIAVTANGTALVVGANTLISNAASGAEFDWYPAAGQWGIVYRTGPSKGASVLMHCWVVP